MIDPNKQKMDFLKYPENYRAVFDVIESGNMRHCSVDELIKHAESLCVYHYKDRKLDQVSAALFIQHLLLTKINKKATIFLIVITVIATLAGLLQAGAAVLAIYPELISKLGLPAPTATTTESPKNSN
jgi:hypothetical protein